MKILIVEDDEQHLQDAINILEKIPGLELLTAKCKADATKIIYNEKPDGVITDIFIPFRIGGHANEPHGLGVAANALMYGIKSVFCTDLFRHSEKLEWLYQIFCDLRGPINSQWGDYMIDNSPEDKCKKDWLKAYEHLIGTERQSVQL